MVSAGSGICSALGLSDGGLAASMLGHPLALCLPRGTGPFSH